MPNQTRVFHQFPSGKRSSQNRPEVQTIFDLLHLQILLQFPGLHSDLQEKPLEILHVTQKELVRLENVVQSGGNLGQKTNCNRRISRQKKSETEPPKIQTCLQKICSKWEVDQIQRSACRIFLLLKML